MIEFGFARSVGRDERIIGQIRSLSRAMGASRPTIVGPAVDWRVVDMAWASQIIAAGGVIQIDPRSSPEDQARQRARHGPHSHTRRRITAGVSAPVPAAAQTR